MRLVIALMLSVGLLFNCIPVATFETDQFNLSPMPLADVGEEVTEYVISQLQEAVHDVNSRIAETEACLAAPRKRGCDLLDDERKRLRYLRSNDAVAKAVYDLVSGSNLLTTKFGNWMRAHKFRGQPSSYKAPFADTIYRLRPSDYLTLSPTVRLYGHEFGIDKLEHLFQQGHQYYTRQREAVDSGKSLSEGSTKAIEWGKLTERTYYGLLTSGVYSNADLTANYVGLKFYQGLSNPVPIGGSRPAMLRLVDGKWAVANRATLHQYLLKPFISDHLNEAFNPSSYAIYLYPSVRRIVRDKACAQWRRVLPELDMQALVSTAKALELWHGEDYGHTARARTLRFSEVCYAPGTLRGRS
ncbi:MAG: hypothetical protein ABR530_01375 [Pyrinomonadaceae bacterium]